MIDYIKVAHDGEIWGGVLRGDPTMISKQNIDKNSDTEGLMSGLVSAWLCLKLPVLRASGFLFYLDGTTVRALSTILIILAPNS